MKKIKAGIIGATGYAGAELVRLLLGHENAEIAAVSSISFAGQSMSEVYPMYAQIFDSVLGDEDEVIEKSDVVFAALPHGLSEKLAKKCTDKGKKLIDIGADFRLTDEAEYEEWYGLKYEYPLLHKKAAYVIPELHRDRVAGKDIIANPGCYPTCAALALAPALKSGFINNDSIIIDSKSGVTGAGRGLTLNTHFAELNEGFGPYKIASHRHTPEIEETLTGIAGEKIRVLFVPHLLPVNRGIESTVYAQLKAGVTMAEVRRAYNDFYCNEKFVRVLPTGQIANIKTVRFSNYCDLSLHEDKRTGRLIISSVIDNMVKGAAGQAVQNMNIMFGIKEDTGINIIPPAF